MPILERKNKKIKISQGNSVLKMKLRLLLKNSIGLDETTDKPVKSINKILSRGEVHSGNTIRNESSSVLPTIARKYDTKQEVSANSSLMNVHYADSRATRLQGTSPQEKLRKSPKTLPGRFRNGSTSVVYSERFT